MHADPQNQYRKRLNDNPPTILDRVNNPWDRVPDVEEYNQAAYNRIVRALKSLKSTARPEAGASSQGILVLGEPGMGKTHLLNRVAQTLSGSNHILFIGRPNWESSVARHIWTNAITSLARSIPGTTGEWSQLETLLANVFTAVLVHEYESNRASSATQEQRRRDIVTRLKADPYNLFTIVGEGTQRQANLEWLRNHTLRYLSSRHPEVDPSLAHMLITYCFVVEPERRRQIQLWLQGHELDADWARALGVQATWEPIDEQSGGAGLSQRREEQALRAIRTLGVLTGYYQPLILAFDELEGLHRDEILTRRWADVVQQIFTTTPNLLVVTCLLPDVWETWSTETLAGSGRGTVERFAAQQVELKPLQPEQALNLLRAHLRSMSVTHGLPTDTYPFMEVDVQRLCDRPLTPRRFLQKVNAELNNWIETPDQTVPPPEPPREKIWATLRQYLEEREYGHQRGWAGKVIPEHDMLGRIEVIVTSLLKANREGVAYGKASCGKKVILDNIILRSPARETLCVAAGNSQGRGFLSYLANFLDVFLQQQQFAHAIFVRDNRCDINGDKANECLSQFRERKGAFLDLNADEIATFSAIYDVIVAVEGGNLETDDHQIDMRDLSDYLGLTGAARRSRLIRAIAARFPPLDRVLPVVEVKSEFTPRPEAVAAPAPPPPVPVQAVRREPGQKQMRSR